jgi:hypothetical protein
MPTNQSTPNLFKYVTDIYADLLARFVQRVDADATYATKAELDELAGDIETGFLPLAGGTMGGDIDMDSNDLVGVHTIQFSGSDMPIGAGVTSTSAPQSITIGINATNSDGPGSVALGYQASVQSADSIVLGRQATVPTLAANAVAIGLAATASDLTAIALGSTTIASGSRAIAVGSGAQSSASNAIAIGVSANNSTANSLLFGASGVVNIRPNGTGACDLGTTAARYKDAHMSGSLVGSSISTLVNNIKSIKFVTTGTPSAGISNTTTPTTVFGAGNGSLTFAANTTIVGTTITLHAIPKVITTLGGATITFALYVDGSSMLALTYTPVVASATGTLMFELQPRDSSTVSASGCLLMNGVSPVISNATTLTWDLTTSHTIDIRAAWDTASATNNLQIASGRVEVGSA